MDIQQIENETLVPMYAKRDITLVRGEGYYLWDSEGNRYYDFASNYGVNILGHSHPAVTNAISQQASTLISCHQSFYNDVRAKYLQKLSEKLPEGLDKVFFCNSGTESVEAAIKFARAATGRSRIIATKRGYHGRTYGALSATADKKYREPYMPLVPDFEHVPYADLEALERSLSEDVAAVILEPVQGESGIYPAPKEYLVGVRAATRKFGALLILDEVQTGFRTGKYFAFEHYDIVPDILCLSKAVANGFPMGLTITSRDVASRLPAGTHGNTFGGNPLACAVALVVLEEIDRGDLLSNAANMGAYLIDRLRSMNSPVVREVRGLGLMIGVELKDRPTKYLRLLQERGFIALPAGATTIRFLPPIIIDQQAIDALIEVFEEVLTAQNFVRS